jgi:hypothetical protein
MQEWGKREYFSTPSIKVFSSISLHFFLLLGGNVGEALGLNS